MIIEILNASGVHVLGSKKYIQNSQGWGIEMGLFGIKLKSHPWLNY